jgi:hemolysin-activating ACP:hemolysin acyltransferase
MRTNAHKQQATENTIVPVAVALWACVSDKIDKTLSDPLVSQPKLQLADWSSGDCLWLMSVAGDPRALPTFLEQLAAKQFKGRRAKVRARGPDGKVSIKLVGRAA